MAATRTFVHNDALDVGDVCPRVDGAECHEGGKEKEDETLPGGARIAHVYAVNDEDGDDATELTGCGGYAVAGAAVAGREDLGGDDEGKGVGT